MICNKEKEKVILAFSGGLDTSYCALYLQEAGFDVITVTVNTGGFSPQDLCEIENKAKDFNVKHYTINACEDFYTKIVTYLIKGNMLRGDVYPLCAGPERIIQASEVVGIAKKESASIIAHGSTGAGNDQVRFDLTCRILAPHIKIIAPIRQKKMRRIEEITYLKEKGYQVDTIIQEYSINQGLLGTTLGGKETLDSWESPPRKVYPNVQPIEKTPDEPKKMTLTFEKGVPVAIDKETFKGREVIKKLSEIGATYGVGVGMHLGDTIFGMKGRVAFEAPAMLILIQAHKELEKLVLTKRQLSWKKFLADAYQDMLHEGLYFDPIMRDIEVFLDHTQQRVCGKVNLVLLKGHVIIEGVKSAYSLMDKKMAIYGEENPLWEGRDAEGFCKIYGLQSVLANNIASQSN